MTLDFSPGDGLQELDFPTPKVEVVEKAQYTAADVYDFHSYLDAERRWTADATAWFEAENKWSGQQVEKFYSDTREVWGSLGYGGRLHSSYTLSGLMQQQNPIFGSIGPLSYSLGAGAGGVLTYSSTSSSTSGAITTSAIGPTPKVVFRDRVQPVALPDGPSVQFIAAVIAIVTVVTVVITIAIAVCV